MIDLLVTRLAPEPRAYEGLFALRMVNSETSDVCWLHQNTPMFEVGAGATRTYLCSRKLVDEVITARTPRLFCQNATVGPLHGKTY